MQELMERFGHRGPNSYWILLSLCTQKFWEHAALNKDKELSELPCVFRFHRRTLLKEMSTRQSHLDEWLKACSELELFSYSYSSRAEDRGLLQSSNEVLQSSNGVEAGVSQSRTQFEISIEMPKLLEILDRDRKKARKKRGESAPPDPEYSEAENKVPHTPKDGAATDGSENQNADGAHEQLYIPGVVVPSEGISATLLMSMIKENRNAAESQLYASIKLNRILEQMRKTVGHER